MEPPLETAVICRKITKSFGMGKLQCEVLHGITMEIKMGELLMLVGPSGSGKTTLISIIAGILSYNSGECIVLNKNLKELSHDSLTQFRGKYLGFVFQAFNLVPMLTARENSAIPLLINRKNRLEAMEDAKTILSQLGLEEHIDRYPTELSGGQQQRVAIARAIIHKPKLIVCDEPTSALDQENGTLVLKQLRHIVDKKDCALLVVTHDSRIFDFADRIIKIEDGHLTQ